MPSSTDAARRTTGSAPAARSAEGLRERARRGTRTSARARRSRRAIVGEGGDRTLVIDQQAEDVVFAELERAARRGRALHARSPRSAAIVDFGDPDAARRRRPDRRLAERQARARRTTRCRSPSPTARRWPTSSSATSTTSAPGEEWRAERGGGRVAQRRAARRRRRPSAARADGRLELVADRVGRPALARAPPSDALLRDVAPRARDRVDRDLAVPGRGRPRRRRWRRCGRCRSVDAAAAQLDRARERRPRRVPGRATTPLGAPLADLEPRSPGRRRAHAGAGSSAAATLPGDR